MFYVYSQKQLQKNLRLVFQPPWDYFTSNKVDGSLRGRGTHAFLGCVVQELGALALPFPKAWKWFKEALELAKSNKNLRKWQRLFSLATLEGIERLEGDVLNEVFDLMGSHSCTELYTWLNYFKDAAASVLRNGGTHLILHIDTYEFAGANRQCRVWLKWGPDVRSPNETPPFFMDFWSTRADCPGGKRDWDMPIKYSVLDNPFPARR
jgi:hypothetical protein